MHLFVFIHVHIVVRLCCDGVIHLPHTYADVIFDLLTNSSMYMCVSVAFVQELSVFGNKEIKINRSITPLF